MKEKKEKLLNVIKSVALKNGTVNANSSCMFIAHQPVAPKQLSELKNKPAPVRKR